MLANSAEAAHLLLDRIDERHEGPQSPPVHSPLQNSMLNEAMSSQFNSPRNATGQRTASGVDGGGRIQSNNMDGDAAGEGGWQQAAGRVLEEQDALPSKRHVQIDTYMKAEQKQQADDRARRRKDLRSRSALKETAKTSALRGSPRSSIKERKHSARRSAHKAQATGSPKSKTTSPINSSAGKRRAMPSYVISQVGADGTPTATDPVVDGPQLHIFEENLDSRLAQLMQDGDILPNIHTNQSPANLVAEAPKGAHRGRHNSVHIGSSHSPTKGQEELHLPDIQTRSPQAYSPNQYAKILGASHLHLKSKHTGRNVKSQLQTFLERKRHPQDVNQGLIYNKPNALKFHDSMFNPQKLKIQIDQQLETKHKSALDTAAGSSNTTRDQKVGINIGFAPRVGADSNFKYLMQISPKYRNIAEQQKERIQQKKQQDKLERERQLPRASSKMALDADEGKAQSKRKDISQLLSRQHMQKLLQQSLLLDGVQISQQQTLEMMENVGMPVSHELSAHLFQPDLQNMQIVYQERALNNPHKVERSIVHLKEYMQAQQTLQTNQDISHISIMDYAFEPNVSHKSMKTVRSQKSMNSLSSATAEPHASSQPQQVKVAYLDQQHRLDQHSLINLKMDWQLNEQSLSPEKRIENLQGKVRQVLSPPQLVSTQTVDLQPGVLSPTTLKHNKTTTTVHIRGTQTQKVSLQTIHSEPYSELDRSDLSVSAVNHQYGLHVKTLASGFSQGQNTNTQPSYQPAEDINTVSGSNTRMPLMPRFKIKQKPDGPSSKSPWPNERDASPEHDGGHYFEQMTLSESKEPMENGVAANSQLKPQAQSPLHGGNGHKRRTLKPKIMSPDLSPRSKASHEYDWRVQQRQVDVNKYVPKFALSNKRSQSSTHFLDYPEQSGPQQYQPQPQSMMIQGMKIEEGHEGTAAGDLTVLSPSQMPSPAASNDFHRYVGRSVQRNTEGTDDGGEEDEILLHQGLPPVQGRTSAKNSKAQMPRRTLNNHLKQVNAGIDHQMILMMQSQKRHSVATEILEPKPEDSPDTPKRGPRDKIHEQQNMNYQLSSAQIQSMHIMEGTGDDAQHGGDKMGVADGQAQDITMDDRDGTIDLLALNTQAENGSYKDITRECHKLAISTTTPRRRQKMRQPMQSYLTGNHNQVTYSAKSLIPSSPNQRRDNKSRKERGNSVNFTRASRANGIVQQLEDVKLGIWEDTTDLKFNEKDFKHPKNSETTEPTHRSRAISKNQSRKNSPNIKLQTTTTNRDRAPFGRNDMNPYPPNQSSQLTSQPSHRILSPPNTDIAQAIFPKPRQQQHQIGGSGIASSNSPPISRMNVESFYVQQQSRALYLHQLNTMLAKKMPRVPQFNSVGVKKMLNEKYGPDQSGFEVLKIMRIDDELLDLTSPDKLLSTNHDVVKPKAEVKMPDHAISKYENEVKPIPKFQFRTLNAKTSNSNAVIKRKVQHALKRQKNSPVMRSNSPPLDKQAEVAAAHAAIQHEHAAASGTATPTKSTKHYRAHPASKLSHISNTSQMSSIHQTPGHLDNLKVGSSVIEDSDAAVTFERNSPGVNSKRPVMKQLRERITRVEIKQETNISKAITKPQCLTNLSQMNCVSLRHQRTLEKTQQNIDKIQLLESNVERYFTHSNNNADLFEDLAKRRLSDHTISERIVEPAYDGPFVNVSYLQANFPKDETLQSNYQSQKTREAHGHADPYNLDHFNQNLEINNEASFVHVQQLDNISLSKLAAKRP